MSDAMAKADRQRAALARLREALDALDEQTRLAGEEPLRATVARQAREALSAEHDDAGREETR